MTIKNCKRIGKAPNHTAMIEISSSFSWMRWWKPILKFFPVGVWSLRSLHIWPQECLFVLMVSSIEKKITVHLYTYIATIETVCLTPTNDQCFLHVHHYEVTYSEKNPSPPVESGIYTLCQNFIINNYEFQKFIKWNLRYMYICQITISIFLKIGLPLYIYICNKVA